jgi:hypothetical protein
LSESPVAIGLVLPDAPSGAAGDPADRFAALEDDLRHYQPAPALGVDEPADEPADETVDERALADSEAVVHDHAAPPEADADTVEPPPPVDEPEPGSEATVFAAVPLAAALAATDTPGPEWTSEVAEAAGEGPEAPALAPAADAGAPSPFDAEPLIGQGTAPEPLDPVLDELERWLAVLQERAGTTS